MFGSAAAQASGCSSAPSGFYPHKQLQSTEYFPLELCLPLWPLIPTRLSTPPHLLPSTPFQQQLHLPVPLMAWSSGNHNHPTKGAAEELSRAALRELTHLHTCVYTHTQRDCVPHHRCITLKHQCVLEWPRSCCSVHHVSLTHTCAQRVFSLDYINSVPTLQKDFKNVPNNRRTNSSFICCSHAGPFIDIRRWSPIPPK